MTMRHVMLPMRTTDSCLAEILFAKPTLNGTNHIELDFRLEVGRVASPMYFQAWDHEVRSNREEDL